jgi:hypothetical protein
MLVIFQEKKMEILKEYEKQDLGYVFKRCTYLDSIFNVVHDCVLVLQKPPSNFKCNEMRSCIVNNRCAKFRCNGLITVAIYDLLSSLFITYLNHRVDTGSNIKDIEYKVNELTIPDDYEEDIEEICAPGIHYFLSLDAALLFEDGNVCGYNENGSPN